MNVRSQIDTTFDFRSDTPPGKDPDTSSPTLRKYHKLLWSKPLPGGIIFTLSDTTPGVYLHHQSSLGEFSLSSDTVIPSFRWDEHIRQLVAEEELNAFNTLGYTIGGMMVFPGNKINNQLTINQARGLKHRLRDRFDLTLECIRRHYLGAESPLDDVLARYASFFALFRDFRGYVEFFLLHDLVSTDFSAVKISVPFDNFRGSPIPHTAEEYNTYMRASFDFIEARNQRILGSA